MSEAGSAEPPRARLAQTFAGARWDEYRDLLGAARAHGYELIALEEWLDRDPAIDGRILVLRHDVDQDPRSAAAMFDVEQAEGVRATWYFRWRTAQPEVVARVRASGAGVGLHYETLTRMVLESDLPATEAPRLVPEARERLRAEIAAFQSRFGPVRSVCPHGDTRAPGVRNASLLEDEDCRAYGIEFDGNAAMRHRRPGYWLTDRTAADGRWSRRASPSMLLADGISPILCVVHPNNWASGLSLWSDRLTRSLAQRRGLGTVVRRAIPSALTDSPPEIDA